MADDSIWAILGIAPTADERAIRIAYTQRLKAIDVDTNAAGLIALRSAYDAAMAALRGERSAGNWLDTPPDEANQAQSGEPPAFRETDTADAPAGGLPPEVAELHRLFEAVATDGRRWLSAEEKTALRRCWAAIADYAVNGNIAQYDAAERAVRWLILGWGSLSVGLVLYAVETFHWEAHEGGIVEDGTIAEIMWRYRAIQFLQRVRRPGHSHHPAWAELTSKYFPGSSRGRVDPWLVHELQAVVRHTWPEVETEFDPGRVALWRNNTADPTHPENPHTRPESRVGRIVGIVFLVLILIRVFGVILGMAGGN